MHQNTASPPCRVFSPLGQDVLVTSTTEESFLEKQWYVHHWLSTITQVNRLQAFNCSEIYVINRQCNRNLKMHSWAVIIYGVCKCNTCIYACIHTVYTVHVYMVWNRQTPCQHLCRLISDLLVQLDLSIPLLCWDQPADKPKQTARNMGRAELLYVDPNFSQITLTATVPAQS